MQTALETTILLVESRIEEILESGDLGSSTHIPINRDGLPTEEYLEAAKKLRFLKGLSTILIMFKEGNY